MMYCYFSSAYKAAIKINGTFFGRIDGDARGIRIDEESVFIEICPLDFGAATGFILDKNFLSSPPPAVSVADLKGGYLIRFFEQPKNSEFKIIAQGKYPQAVITVFYENGLKASVETPQGFISEVFPFNAKKAEISDVNVSGRNVVAIFFPENSAICLYDLSKAPVKLGEISADAFSMENDFSTTLNKKDMAKHKIVSRYTIKDGKLYESERTVQISENFDKTALPAALVPYAFFEELNCGGDYAFYLSEKVKENADKLKTYFGEFLSVMPPPPFRNENEIGLIYKAGKNKYSVDYASVEISDGKITNLKRSET